MKPAGVGIVVGEQNGLGCPAGADLGEQLVDEARDIRLRVRRVEPDPSAPLVPQAVLGSGEEAGCPDGLLRDGCGRGVEVDGSEARPSRLDVLGRRVPLVLAGELRAVVASLGFSIPVHMTR